MTAPDWSLANCLNVHGDLFFPTAEGNTNHAKAICRPCPIRIECGQYAIEHRLEGIWGGMSSRDRRILLRRRARALQKANQARKVTA